MAPVSTWRRAEAENGIRIKDMFFVYILKSLGFKKTYVGRTSDVEKRLYEHNTSSNEFSRRYKPWEIIYTEKLETLEESIKREKYFKSAAGRKWIKKNLFTN